MKSSQKKKKREKFPKQLAGVFIASAFVLLAFVLLFTLYPKDKPAPATHEERIANIVELASRTPSTETKKPASRTTTSLPIVPQTHPAGPYTDAREELLKKINMVRIATGLDPLTRNVKLDASAQAKADAMVKLGFFAHNDPDGSAPWHYIAEAGYKAGYEGENLSKDFDPDEAFQAWMNSPTHKANILNPHYQETGFAIEGEYIVEHFASPAL